MTYPERNLVSTKDIAAEGRYYETPSDFFSNFKMAWNSVKSQVLKLETRQYYTEKGNPSWELMIQGKFSEAVALIPEARKGDIPYIYERIEEKKVDFIRCRPVVVPVSDYIKWEFEVYKFNAKHGERIYCVDRSLLEDLFDTCAMHDFMVFDYRKAFIHNYDDNGQIHGGWVIDDPKAVQDLIKLYAVIRAYCVDFSNFTLDI